MSPTLISSPLQGFTDFRFRNALHKHFGGIDTYYAPYIRLNGKFEIKPGYQRDLDIKNNESIHVIPQVMTCSADEFIFVIKYVRSLGYTELNWNLGCPYPMVTNKGMGSGLIVDPQKIDHILGRVHDETDITISMKMRMGYHNAEEIIHAFPTLNKYPLKSIGIHARIGQQLYVGGVDLDGFSRCLDHTGHKLYYNGDITTVQGYRAMAERFPSIDHWMIGRGLISDPFLPSMIKNNETEYPEDRTFRFKRFHESLLNEYINKLSGDKAVIQKMLSFWKYFSMTFNEPHKCIKRIKKTKTLDAYDDAVNENLEIMENSMSYT